ncbi:Fc.00g098480.m01.CDS01 [Cosmosporella sp. VM-42]
MAYHTYSLGGDGGRIFSGHSLLSYYDSGVNNDQHGVFHGAIDPNLESCDSFSGRSQEHCGVPQMERYLLERHNPLIQAPQMHPMQANPFTTVKPDMIPALAPRSQGRRGSPFSQHYSSVASGAQSPLTESYGSTQGPSTPPDMAVMSPYLDSMPYEQCENNSSQFSLAGIAYMPSGGCINPSKINPSHDASIDHCEPEPAIEFSLHRGSSFDSETSQFQEPSFNQPSFVHPMSPEPSPPTVKQEIYANPTEAPIYPDPENIDEDVKSSDEIVVEPRRSREDDDEDYKPNSRARSTKNQKNTTRRTRQKRSSMSTLTEKPRAFKQTVSSGDNSRRLLSSMASSSKACSECSHSFKDDTALQKHTKTQHTRPFICVFHFAGCDSTFAAKNEWKRHVLAQHLALYYWLCDYDSCGQAVSRDCQQSGVPTHGRPFRRKDLFTQHARRMHTPQTTHRPGKGKQSAPEWEEQLRNMQEDAHRQRCTLPIYMRCPAQNCTIEFHGEKAWDDRMEHVARHLERAANDEEPKMRFGGPNDDTLTNWAASDAVGVIRRNGLGWETCSPLKDANLADNPRVRRASSADEDAEGEDYF